MRPFLIALGPLCFALAAPSLALGASQPSYPCKGAVIPHHSHCVAASTSSSAPLRALAHAPKEGIRRVKFQYYQEKQPPGSKWGQ